MHLAAAVAFVLFAGAEPASTPGIPEKPHSATVIGPSNLLLAQGATALEQGRAEEGVRLTLEGLKFPSAQRDTAAGHANLCAGYSMLKQWDEALRHCDKSIELDPGNWRAFNNRAAVFVAKGLYDRALTDVQSGLEIAPNSSTLRKSLEVVYERKRTLDQSVRTRTPADS
jgi:tetratricopeptide (TPR) repeat protein